MTNTTARTPGPWMLDDRFPANVYSDDVLGSIIATCAGFEYAQRLPAEQAANAAFIVRAANSHDELVRALQLIEPVWAALLAKNHGGTPEEQREPILNAIRAALAKARQP